MDQFDRAQEFEARYRDGAIACVLASAPTGPGTTHCIECGEPIPEARRQAVPGCTLCVTCQAQREEQ